MAREEPAYRIRTDRLVLRCLEPSDASLAAVAVRESVEHLRPWLPWVKEPEDAEAYMVRFRNFRAAFDQDREYVYGVFDPAETKVLGATGLHRRVGERALEIGYWLHVDHTGQGLATEMCSALVKVAFSFESIERLDIQCDPKNVRSARVAERLGFRHEATLRKRQVGVDGAMRDAMYWTLLKEELPTSPCAAVKLEAFDVLGRRLPID